MSTALLTGVSGLISHQKMLDVVGNNIANVNTHGYKQQTVHFADHFYENFRPATSPRAEGLGGTNGSQVGHGVHISQVDRNFSGGTLEETGDPLHMAIEGNGFFMVSDGGANFFTRVGNFTVDAEGVLVASGGYEVQRLPNVGEPNGVDPGFQIPGDSRIFLKENAAIPAKATSEISVSGNLSDSVTPPTRAVHRSEVPFADEGKNLADRDTLFNELSTNTRDYVDGDFIEITIKDVDGSEPAPIELPADGTTTIGDVVDAINSVATGFNADLINGNIVLTANETGPATFSVKLDDNDNQMQFGTHDISLKQAGSDEGAVLRMTTIFDPKGNAHDVQLKFERVDDNDWRLTASIDESVGEISNDVIEPITFTQDGRLESAAEKSIGVDLFGFDDIQFIRLDFSAESTSQSGEGTTTVTSDGYAAGTVESHYIDSDGTIYGRNSGGGPDVAMAQLAVVSFQNEKGLRAIGDNFFVNSLNSGDPEIGVAAMGRKGHVRSGVLESSNVDIAFEFTRLIVAQRGFSANARTITVADEVLEELTNIIR